MEKYQNKYRIKSARLQAYDYGSAGLYFITICTANREHYFGEIIDGKMQLSNIGILADVFWHEIKKHSKNIELHQFVVMPNHIHGILQILQNGGGDDGGVDGGDGDDVGVDGRDVACNVSTDQTSPTDNTTNKPIPPIDHHETMSKISPKSGTIGRIIGSYKGAVSKHAKRLGLQFQWQSRFHDHIIRDENSFKRIENYIINNPKNWIDDKFNKE